jgi:putative transposase
MGTRILAQSVGQARTEAVSKYLDEQPSHHGYDRRIHPPVYSFRAEKPVLLTANHCVFDLQHHLVLSTNYRRGVFTAEMGRDLTSYWLRVAAKHNFAIDQLSSVPDHIHMRVRVVPSMSIEECALLLMNNGQHFMDKHFPYEMARAGLDRLWQASAYAGTIGSYTTGLLQKWLGSDE